MERMSHIGPCPGMRYATANVALGDSPIWGRRQEGVLHDHPVYMLEYVKHGSMTFCMAGQTPVALSAGAYYITAPGEVHSHAVAEDISTFHLALRPEFVRGVLTEATGGTGGTFCFPQPARRASAQVEQTVRRMVHEARHPAPWRNLLLDTLATTLLIQLVVDHGLSVGEEGQHEIPDGVSRAIELILNAYDSPLNLSSLAAHAGMSRYHFLRCFKERTGKTPTAYLKQIRVEEARDLLERTDLPVTEVAMRVGFAGSNRLAEAIRQAYGTAPMEIRLQAKRSAQ